MKKTSLIFIALIALTSFFAIDAYTFSSGITGRTNKNGGSGCSCHNVTPNTEVQVSINGPDTLAPLQSATYTVTITGGPAVKAGVNIASSAGVLLLIQNQGLQLNSGELTHSAPKDFIQGSVSFQFNYVAPSQTGTATLYATGNSVNNADGNQGDAWNHAPNKVITVAEISSVKEDGRIASGFALQQNYPNPFTPSTQIPFTLTESSSVVLEVFDVSGKKIALLLNERKSAGSYSIPFSAGAYSLASGSYFYQLTVNGVKQTRQMVLIK